MTYIHDRDFGYYDFDASETEAPNPEITRLISAPGFNYTLVRSRLFFEARILAYSQTDTEQPDDAWWQGIYGVLGLWYDASAAIPPQSFEPIDDINDPNWIVWVGLHGFNESMVTTHNGWHRWVRVYRARVDMINSEAQRQPHGEATQSVWLSYKFNDPNTFIDRTHATYDVLYSLNYQFASDLIWKLKS